VTRSRPTPARQARLHKIPIAVVAALLFSSMPAMANNYGESLAWQFKTSADRANLAAILDMIQKRRGGYYAAPAYTTNIAHQYNCLIAATATGNSGAQTALANSPTVTGATSSADGNDSATTVADGHGAAAVNGTQTNSGTVTSGVTGATVTDVQGTASQALNSDQDNSGDQTATVQNAHACAFAALN
jgi:hypothetical protein